MQHLIGVINAIDNKAINAMVYLHIRYGVLLLRHMQRIRIISLMILVTCLIQTKAFSLDSDYPRVTMTPETRELFYDFIGNFATDSVFQLDRIQFPLKIQTINETKIIEKNYWKHDFLYASLEYMTFIFNSLDYSFSYDIDFGDKAIFSWIYPSSKQIKNYYFIRMNDKWFLSKISISTLNPNSNEDFIPFLKKFMADSVFQVSRIKFPIKLKTWYDSDEEEFADTTYVLNKNDWKFCTVYNGLDSLTNFQHDWNTQPKINNEVQFFLSGVENGISFSFYFKLIDGKWYLIKETDEST